MLLILFSPSQQAALHLIYISPFLPVPLRCLLVTHPSHFCLLMEQRPLSCLNAVIIKLSRRVLGHFCLNASSGFTCGSSSSSGHWRLRGPLNPPTCLFPPCLRPLENKAALPFHCAPSQLLQHSESSFLQGFSVDTRRNQPHGSHHQQISPVWELPGELVSNAVLQGRNVGGKAHPFSWTAMLFKVRWL